ncbi:MAG: tryptophan--tRNA ligase [Candidatus Yanofskybacteria bacterium RIFCSPHIGHO2_02_FULL_44_12b]|uniref:Tryptophan--tRNA ligase n=1 Tax=Candidatus Yanofskybacteria bacterium RIFCSPLOWO2_01_FULL_44_22 TaxID=1802697 RepID=A0A1F8GNC7_9BACT|nr:MAG: tryptophan--tRNA ligase [Candidatus Yanofskybacteria bacterium RIFCSPHIGHO2_01_FULL_44_24]OGN15250.1 MAG: tryptophan--tRNA ligase [Candidatus Yanofskybacteria bacterium RIFCSPHIGHO2_02_FULL_44_12b]OGN26912.1 MAG: tryptophan--tRNA ligase [Candidatus Yanofskybacteria bacterium RIFCSPLOWO2_01_FULL_44_22]
MTKVFSGIRPSGKLHLGNYLGAIKNWIELQNKADQAIFAVVDLHGITTPYDPKNYKEQVMDVVLDYLAAGVDPKKSLLIRQSKVPQHTELGWIFNTITPVSWLDRLPNYREKVSQVEQSGEENSKSYQNNLSILAYPVLMAADILLYKSNLVPVGDDQKQHIDLTNEIGARFNHVFGEVFPNVKAHIVQGARIMSLQDPSKKMSKTGDEGIALSDEPDVIRAKFKKATTDSGKEIKFDEKEKSGISNLLTIYSLLSGKDIKKIEADYGGKGYVEFKNDLAEVVVEFLKPFQDKRRELEKDPKHVIQILERSEEEARKLAQKTLDEVKQLMGLL